MTKRFTFSLTCIVLCLTIVFGLCSCNQRFKYDWTALDTFMEEHGESNTNFAQFIHGSGNVKTIVIHNEKDDNSKTVIQIVKLQEKEKIRYYLQFEVLYYNLIQYRTVKFEYVWFLPFDTSDKYYENRNFIEFACYKTGCESAAEKEYWASLDKVGVVIDNIQLDEGQFSGCEYLFYRQYAYDKHDYYKAIELKESYDYYFNEMLTKSFSITTEFLNANNIPSFYGFAKDMRQIVLISDDDLL